MRVAASCMGLVVVALTSSGAWAQWTATSLHPAGYQFGTSASSAADGHQYGNWGGHAAVWSGSAASVVDIHPNLPPQFVFGSAINASSGGVQAGSYSFVLLGVGNRTGACMWSGSSGTWVDLHPGGQGWSTVLGMGGGSLAGYQQTFDFETGGAQYAEIWSVATHAMTFTGPAGSIANATDGVQHVGRVGGFSPQAAMWSGTPVTQTVLHPSGASTSAATGVSGGHQAGWVQAAGATHAGYWSGTASSWVDLNPSGATNSTANGISGVYMVGKANIGGVDHAGTWAIDTGVFTDLQAFMPANCVSSIARGLSIEGSTLTVVGEAQITESTGTITEAYMWSRSIPEPGGGCVVIAGALMALRRRRSC